ncbi:MAG: TetR/AcrR family transcriptional regulator C-terminal domain-containing protein [Pseudomonas sp.]
MSDETKAAAPAKTALTKRVGRRPKSSQDVSRAAMIASAINIARTESLTEVSMVRIGKELGVAAGMVHYHLGSRDELISAVINAAFKERVERLPVPTGNWRTDLEQFAQSSLDTMERWPGLATYILTENKFRLFQRVQPGEIDYGLAYFNHVGKIIKATGFSGPMGAMVYHLLLLFITVIAAEKENRQSPQTHADFISGYLKKFDQDSFPGAAYLALPFSSLDSPASYDAGIEILLDGFENWIGLPADTSV